MLNTITEPVYAYRKTCIIDVIIATIDFQGFAGKIQKYFVYYFLRIIFQYFSTILNIFQQIWTFFDNFQHFQPFRL